MVLLPRHCDKCHDYIKYGLHELIREEQSVPNYYCQECFIDITGKSPSNYYKDKENT